MKLLHLFAQRVLSHSKHNFSTMSPFVLALVGTKVPSCYDLMKH